MKPAYLLGLWGFFMRDFVQNFYDAIGSKDFAKRFVRNHENGELIMQSIMFHTHVRAISLAIKILRK